MALDISSTGLSDSLVILGAAGIVIPAFARFRITPIIGFILVGILVGPHGLGAFVEELPWLYWVTITDRAAMAPFAELGIILLLFSIGLELSRRRLWSMRRQIVGFGGGELIGCALLIALAFLALGNSPNASLGLGLALALSSTALVLPIAGTTSPVGRLALAMLLFEDVALVPIIFALSVLSPAGGEAAAFLASLAAGLAVIVAMLVAGRTILPLLFAQAARTKSPELFVAATLLVVISASVATLAVGLSPLLGALVAGVLIAETDYAHEVADVVAPFRGLALGIFLITVGMSLDLPMIARAWPELLAATAAVVAIKAVVTSGLLRFGGVAPGTSAETGLLMAAPSETTLIVLAAALQAGLISAPAANFWTVVTAIGLTITPLLARTGRAVARRLEEAREAALPTPAFAGGTLIVGYGRVGRMVADLLDAHNKPWLAIDDDVDTVRAARRDGKSVVFGDAGRPGVLEHHGLSAAQAAVLTMDDPVQAVRLTEALRQLQPSLTIVARARDGSHAARLYEAGATDAVPETLESSLQLAENVLVDLGVPMGFVIASIHDKREQLRALIKEEGRLDEAPRLKSRAAG